MEELTLLIQCVYLLFFLVINSVYLILNFVAFLVLPRYLQRQVLNHGLPQIHTSFKTPISIIIAAYNEEAVIVASIRSLLQLDYPEFEIVVVNDGSKDGTLEVLKQEFSLVAFPEAFRVRIPHQQIRTVYQSLTCPELRVIDKQNGGSKADAINAGINGSRYPLICPLDADTIMQSDSLKLLAQPFLEDSRTIAVGGNVRIANGCQVSRGFLTRISTSQNYLALFQTLEYLRAFLFSRVGWSALDALPLISGAFGLFRKESVITVGGYLRNSLGEDMELILRLHRHYRLAGIPYRIGFVADPACWTEAPESLRVLKNQRVRWQRGLLESLSLNRQLLFHARSGILGWIALPFLFVFEGFGPLIETSGYVVMLVALISGAISWEAFGAFLLMALGLGILLSTTAVLLEELAFHTYPKTRDLLRLIAVSVLENFGFRQMTLWWRVIGCYRWLRNSNSHWGEMSRTASWQKPAPGMQQPGK
jgi:cellulose synthase/poly-beta-1,6-N-acetylglucosamine synthase-like glycosyltransferase